VGVETRRFGNYICFRPQVRKENRTDGTVHLQCPCECGRSYSDETGIPLAIHLREHRHSLKEGLLEELCLSQHAYEEGQRVGLHDARILEIESNCRYKK
jgi:hypothetical protein